MFVLFRTHVNGEIFFNVQNITKYLLIAIALSEGLDNLTLIK